jgi:hypothetical protein
MEEPEKSSHPVYPLTAMLKAERKGEALAQTSKNLRNFNLFYFST